MDRWLIEKQVNTGILDKWDTSYMRYYPYGILAMGLWSIGRLVNVYAGQLGYWSTEITVNLDTEQPEYWISKILDNCGISYLG